LARAHVDVVGPGEIRAVCRAKEAEAVLKDFEHAFAEDVLAVLRVRLQDREDDVLLARAREVLETHGFRELHERGRRPRLQLGQIHGVLRRFELRGRNDVEFLVVRKLLAHRPAAATAPAPAAVAPIAFAVPVTLVGAAAVFHSRSRGIA
jgi:hypothetical protein